MSCFTDILDRLPSLYRPEPDDAALFTAFVRCVATELDEVHARATEVLQAHWSGYADRALYDRYFLRTRELAGLAPPAAADPALADFPYLHDLANMAALVNIHPWEKERVEAFRARVRGMVNVYKGGLGTLGAIRAITEAYLGETRPFWLEAVPARVSAPQPAPTRGAPDTILGPLMRWDIESGPTRKPGMMTLYIQGVQAQPGRVEATTKPAVELYQAGGAMPRLAIAYKDTLAPGETLRLRPAYASWLGGPAGIARGTALPDKENLADPSAPGPWTTLAGGPTQHVTALAQSCERSLWAASNTALWRFDGRSWNAVLTGLAQIHCLLAHGQRLLIGTDTGLLSLPIGSGTAETMLTGRCHTLYADGDDIWLGTDSGAGRLQFSGTAATREAFLENVSVYAIYRDASGLLFFGASLGLFHYQPGTARWFYYSGGGHTEQVRDWQPYNPATDTLPDESQVFLPGVRCITRGPDNTLWLGTDSGMARYIARSVDGLAYETVCEAFVDLCRGPVHAIATDERGLVWFATDRGLFRYDGRSFWHYSGGAWQHLGKTGSVYTPERAARGAWRYLRATASWQRYTSTSSDWITYTTACVTTEEDPVYALCWTDAVAADLGQWDGAHFTPSAAVDPAKLCMRYKPDEKHILAGGLPAVPRLPVGKSTWRYLRLEEEPPPQPERTPCWSPEGRLMDAPHASVSLLPAHAGLPDFHDKAPWEGRYGSPKHARLSRYDDAVFAYPPAARIWYAAETRPPLGVCVRLKKMSATETIDPLMLARVAAAIRQVQPAGVPVELFVEEEKYREESHG